MEPKGPYYTPELGKAVASTARPHKNPDIHILPGEGRWIVLAAGRLRAIRILEKKSEAIRIAKEVASRKKSKRIVIHKKNTGVEREIYL